jgi:hypothetical protein
MNRTLNIFAASTFAICAGFSTNTFAQTVASPLAFVAGAGFAHGGDTIIVGTYPDGETRNAKAGNGLEVYLGGAWRVSDKFALQADVGYQTSTADGNIGEFTFKRYPIELLGYFYLSNNWRLGAGARFDERVKLTGTGSVAGLNQDFENASGAVAEIEYLIEPDVGIKFRAVNENFKVSTDGYSKTYNGNQAAIMVTIYY